MRISLDRIGRELTLDRLATEFDWVDEEAWGELSEAGLISGDSVGKVRIFVATGTEFLSGAVPGTDAQGNTEIEETFNTLKVVDPYPMVSGSSLSLYFSGNQPDTDSSSGGDYAWGIWRASAVPAD